MSNSHWNFDLAHSRLGFVVKHMMFAKVRGNFESWSGDLSYDPENPGSAKATASIDVASIDTGNEDRDNHLKSGDFFNAEEFPTINFESKSFAPKDGHIEVTGDLTIKGITNEVTIQVEELGKSTDPWGQTRIGFTISGAIDRTDFGLKWNQALEAGGVLVGEQVKFDIDLQATEVSEEEDAA